MRNVADILGINFDIISPSETLESIKGFISGDTARTVFTPNPEIIMACQKDSELLDIINSGDLLLADGIGILIASKILRKGIKERVTGIDTVTKLFEAYKDGSASFFLFGAAEGVAETAVEKVKQKFPQINIAGCRNGYFTESDCEQIVGEINNSGADILMVALGAPKQEKWITKYKSRLNVKVCLGIGGSFDVIAGKVKRAPMLMRKLGLEWLYRLIKQPSRFKRMLKLPQFLWVVVCRRFQY